MAWETGTPLYRRASRIVRALAIDVIARLPTCRRTLRHQWSTEVRLTRRASCDHYQTNGTSRERTRPA
jgi:hypothetical protein